MRAFVSHTHIMSKPPAGCQSADAAQHTVSYLYKISSDLPDRNLVKMSSRASPDNPCNINHQTVIGTVFQPEKLLWYYQTQPGKICLWWHFCKLLNYIKLIFAHFVTLSKWNIELEALKACSGKILLHYAVWKFNASLSASLGLKIMHLNQVLKLTNKANVN